MRTHTYMIVAAAASQGIIASPNPTSTFLGTLPGNNKPPRTVTDTTYIDTKPCPTPVATHTTTALRAICDIVCLPPTSLCSPGEPTGPTPRPPVTQTIVPAGACVETLQVIDNPGCGNCASCASVTPLRARQTTLPGEQWCDPTTTVSTTVGPQSTEICNCLKIFRSCSSGEPTRKPLPTTTVVEGCTESVIAGPGDCSNVCPLCFN